MSQPEAAPASEQEAVLVTDMFPNNRLYIAIIAAVLPFVASFHQSSSVTVDGEVTQSSYTDPVALIGGAVALLFGFWGLRRSNRVEKSSVRKAIWANLAVMAVGVFHLLRGKGVL